MGKKVMSHQASFKITKQNNHHEGYHNKKQLNSLIEVLRPKVYITDSSNFKRLVQELTGNGSSSSSTIPFPASPRWTETVLEIENNTPVIEIIEDDRDIQASMDSFDSFERCHNIISAEGFGEAENRMYLNDATYDMSSTNQSGEDWLAYHDLETWLLDIEQPCPSFNGVMQNQEASLYDYELSSLI